MRIKIGIAAAILSTAVPASAEETATYFLKVHVPVFCSVDFSLAESGPNNASGLLSEYCNAPAGYEVRALYTPGQAAGTVLNVDGQRVVLDGSGSTLINSAPGASIRRLNVSVEGTTDPNAPISFMITPRMI